MQRLGRKTRRSTWRSRIMQDWTYNQLYAVRRSASLPRGAARSCDAPSPSDAALGGGGTNLPLRFRQALTQAPQPSHRSTSTSVTMAEEDAASQFTANDAPKPPRARVPAHLRIRRRCCRKAFLMQGSLFHSNVMLNLFQLRPLASHSPCCMIKNIKSSRLTTVIC